ncbi:hypothetical protein ACIQWA_38565 [Kitasatospora sp. NPDC098652]|uniref:hypothetical protein n=1 Tax=Kitasatospora sp. NPDC098652 TaxID=3364095 RepID=UPI00381EEA5A
MGRHKKAVPDGAFAKRLAVYLRGLRERSGKTYEAMGPYSVATFSRADSGASKPSWPVVEAYVRACGGRPSELRKAARLWQETPASQSAADALADGADAWPEPDALVEPHQLGEAMRIARKACGGPSLRELEARAARLGEQLSRSTVSDALRSPGGPQLRTFCAFMRVIADYPRSPAAGYPARVWAEAWHRVQEGSGRAVPDVGPGHPTAARGRAPSAGEGRRRPRLLTRPWAPPGPLRDLKDALHDLYLSAGAPSLADIAGAVRLDDSLAAAPERDSIRRLLRSPQLPPNPHDAVAVASVLARMAGVGAGEAALRARNLWIAAAAEPPYGHAVADLLDPIALGVRPTFAFPDMPDTLPTLTPYVDRLHDRALLDVVRMGVGGHSGIVIARGEPSTGKTRSCWEAVRSLPADWRLWYPANPSDTGQVLQALAGAGPRTVVWLDRIDRYLDTAQGVTAQRIHDEIRQALSDTRRAPVLVIGTVCDSARMLTGEGSEDPPNAAALMLIEEAGVNVPNSLTGSELLGLAALAHRDPRLSLAQATAKETAVQFLASNHGAHPVVNAYSFHTAVTTRDTDTLVVGARLLHETGRPREAVAWYQAAAEAGDSQAVRSAASLLSESGDLAEAISWLRERADAGDTHAALEAARQLEHDGQDEEAITLYQRAAQTGGKSQALRSAAAVLRRHGRAPEALAWLQGRARDGDEKAHREAAHLRWTTGDREGGLRSYEEAVAAGDTTALREAAEHLQAADRVEEAIDWYRRAVRGGDKVALRPLADLLKAEGDLDGALPYYLRAAELSDVLAMHQAAALYRLGKQPARALHWYREASRHGDDSALLHIAALHQEAGRIDTALTWYARAADSRIRDAYREAVWMLWDAGRLDDAYAWLAGRVDNGDRRALRELGDLLREAGRLPEALAWYRRSAELGSRYSLRHVARLEARLGNPPVR